MIFTVLQYKYFDAKEEKLNNSYLLESDPDFPFLINLTDSAVQTPTDVYQHSMFNSIF